MAANPNPPSSISDAFTLKFLDDAMTTINAIKEYHLHPHWKRAVQHAENAIEELRQIKAGDLM